jgi:glycosyltransferase 2 family protein
VTSRLWIRRIVSILLTGAALVFIGLEIVRNLDELREFDWEVRPSLLLLSTVLLVVVLLWGVRVWQMVLWRFGVEVDYRLLARTWFWANLSRYIPGVIWQFVSLAHLGGAAGMKPVTTVTSMLVHMGFSLLSAALLAVYLLPLEAIGVTGELAILLRWLAPLSLMLVHPTLIQVGLRLVHRMLRRPVAIWTGSAADGLVLLAYSTVSWVLYGATFYLFLSAFHPLPLFTLPAITAMNGLAFIVGYLVFFAPGGLGYKEGALAFLLATLMPRPVAFSLAIAARLWTIVAELLPAAFLIRRGAVPVNPGREAASGQP